MAENTSSYSVKLSDSEKERARALAERSGLTQREWFTKLLELSEIDSMKENFQDFAADLEELQVHTERIYKNVANIVQRSNHLRIAETEDLIAKVEKKEELIDKIQDELNGFKDDVAAAKEAQKVAESNNLELEKKLDEMQKNVENTQLLVEQYKEKNEFLTSELMKYKTFETENEELKNQLASTKEEFGQDLKRLEAEKAVLAQQNQELVQSIELQKKECEIAVKEAIVDTRGTIQSQVESMREKHQATIDKMRDEHQVEINKMRDANEAALAKQQTDFDKERKAFEAKLEALEKQVKAKSDNK